MQLNFVFYNSVFSRKTKDSFVKRSLLFPGNKSDLGAEALLDA
jgi:hypothetical protein